MSWLDLPPLELIGAAPDPVVTPDENGLVKGLLGLVAGGLVGFWTTSTVEIWHPDNPAALAAILGVGEVERMDAGTGFAECGLLDREKKVLRVRNRNPRSGPPRVPGAYDRGSRPGPGPARGVAAHAHGGRRRPA